MPGPHKRRCRCGSLECSPFGSRQEVQRFTLLFVQAAAVAFLSFGVLWRASLAGPAVFVLNAMDIGLIAVLAAFCLVVALKCPHLGMLVLPFLPFVQMLYAFIYSGGDALANPKDVVIVYPLILWVVSVFGTSITRTLEFTMIGSYTFAVVYWPIATALNPATADFWEGRVPRFAALFLCHACFIVLFLFSFKSFRKEIQRHSTITEELQAAAFVAENLLAAALPSNVARALLAGKPPEALTKNFESATIAFIHLCDYDKFVATLEAGALISKLNHIYSAFDSLLESMPTIFKIETIGSTYLVASGLPSTNEYHAEDMIQFLLLLQELCRDIDGHPVDLKIGVNSGPVAAGIIGQARCFYRVFGSTVNIASRMMSHGVKNRIHVSPSTKALLDDLATEERIEFEERGEILVKGRGAMNTTFVGRGRLFDDLAEDQQDGLTMERLRQTVRTQEGAAEMLLRLTNFAVAKERQPDQARALTRFVTRRKRSIPINHLAAPTRQASSGRAPQGGVAAGDAEAKAPAPSPSQLLMTQLQPSRRLRLGKSSKDFGSAALASAYLRVAVSDHIETGSTAHTETDAAESSVGRHARWARPAHHDQHHFLSTMIQAVERFRDSGTVSARTHNTRPSVMAHVAGALSDPDEKKVAPSPLRATPVESAETWQFPQRVVSDSEVHALSRKSFNVLHPMSSEKESHELPSEHENGVVDAGPTSAPQETVRDETYAVQPLSKSKRFASRKRLQVRLDSPGGEPKREPPPPSQPQPQPRARSVPKRPVMSSSERTNRRKSWIATLQRSQKHVNNSSRGGMQRGGGMTSFQFPAQRKRRCWCGCRYGRKRRIQPRLVSVQQSFEDIHNSMFSRFGSLDSHHSNESSRQSPAVSSEHHNSMLYHFDEEGNPLSTPKHGIRGSPLPHAGASEAHSDKSEAWVVKNMRIGNVKMRLRDIARAGTISTGNKTPFRPSHAAGIQSHKYHFLKRWCANTARFGWFLASKCSRPFTQPSLEANFHSVQLNDDSRNAVRAFGISTCWFFAMGAFTLLSYQAPQTRSWAIAATCILFLLSFAVLAFTLSPIVSAQPGVVGRLRLHTLLTVAFMLQWAAMIIGFVITSVPAAEAVTYRDPDEVVDGRYVVIDCGYLFMYTVVSQLVAGMLPIFPFGQGILQVVVAVVSPTLVLGTGGYTCTAAITEPLPGTLFGTYNTSALDIITAITTVSPTVARSDMLVETCMSPWPWSVVASIIAGTLVWLISYRQERRHRRQFLIARAIIEAQKDTNVMLENLFPSQVVKALKSGKTIKPRLHNQVGVLWCDLINFTPLADSMSAKQLMMLLNKIFSSFDDICSSRNLWKMDTVGDAYVVLGGLFQSVEEMYFASLIAHQREDTGKRRSLQGSPYASGDDHDDENDAEEKALHDDSFPSRGSRSQFSFPSLPSHRKSAHSLGGPRSSVHRQHTASSRFVSKEHAGYVGLINMHHGDSPEISNRLTGQLVIPHDEFDSSGSGDDVASIPSREEFHDMQEPAPSLSSTRTGVASDADFQKHQALFKLKTHKLRQVLDDMFSIGNEMQAVLDALNLSIGSDVGMRVGVHCGNVITGIVGNLRPRFHVFGVSVLRAEEMESTGKRGAVHCSPEARDAYFSSAFSFQPHTRGAPSRTASTATSTQLRRSDGDYLHGYFVEPLTSASPHANSLFLPNQLVSRVDM